MSSTISETCSCGSTFEFTGDDGYLELTNNVEADQASTARDDLIRLLQTVEDSDDFTSGAIANALLEAGWKSPDDTNALTNQAIAYNGLMWRLAVAFGLAADGDEIIDVDLADLADKAVTAARASVQDGEPNA